MSEPLKRIKGFSRKTGMMRPSIRLSCELLNILLDEPITKSQYRSMFAYFLCGIALIKRYSLGDFGQYQGIRDQYHQ